MAFRISRRRLYWLLQVLCWGLFGALGILIILLTGQKMTASSLAVQLFMMALYISTTHGFRYLIRRGGWLKLPVGQVLLRLLPLNLSVAFLTQCVVSLLMIYGLHVFTLEQFRWSYLLLYTLNMNFVFWLWTGLYFGLHYLDNYKQADIDKWKLTAAVREAEMQTLKAQINPHFLFNGLNNIRALIGEDPERARTMVSHLSELLRYAIQLNRTEQVPLRRELAVVRDYLQLEALQLEERLQYTLDVPENCLNVAVPPMLVQGLVENAIKHGIAPRPEGGTLHIQARCADGSLLLTVENTGRLIADPASTLRPDGTGTGLRNATERLRLLFGQQAELRLEQATPNTVAARVRLPLSFNELPTSPGHLTLHPTASL